MRSKEFHQGGRILVTSLAKPLLTKKCWFKAVLAFQSNFGVSSKMLGGWNMLKPQSTVCRLCWFPSTWAPMNQWIELWFCCWLSGQKSCGWFRSFCSHGVAKDASKAGRLPLHRLWISMSLGAQPWNMTSRQGSSSTILLGRFGWVVCSWIMVNVC